MYARLDRWLKKMSSLGWHIVHTGSFSFLFEKGEPSTKEYFTGFYHWLRGDIKYNVLLLHPLFEKTYAVKKKKSKINSNETKKHLIVEIDLAKIDVQNNVEYKKIILERNRLHLLFFIRNAAMIIFSLIIIIVFGFIM